MKRQTKNEVLNLAFCAALLVPVLWFAMHRFSERREIELQINHPADNDY